MQNIREVGFLELLDGHGKAVFLDSVWHGELTVMTLTRHFGCLFCIEQVTAMCAVKSDLEALGAQLVIIGNGNPSHARDFMRRFDLSKNVFTDPARILYQRLELIHGVRSTINWASTKHSRRAASEGFRQEAVQGDRWQQGGTFVIAPTGKILYEYRSVVAGDHAPVQKILKVVRNATTHRPKSS